MASPKIRSKNSTNGRIVRWRLRFLRRSVARLARLSPELAAAWGVKTFLTPVRYVAPEIESTTLAKGRSFSIRCRDAAGRRRRLATWTFGTSGPAVLLVHGWSGRGGQMHPLIEPLVAAGLSVIVFDAPGHGRSTGKETSLVDFALAIRAIDKQIGPIRAMIGHSLGGAAAALTTLEPLPSGRQIARLVTIGSPCTSAGALARFGDAFGLSPEIVQRMRSRLEKRYGRSMDDFDLRRPGPRPDLLVVHDRGDQEVPFSEATELARAWNDAQLLATEGQGHKRILRYPAVINEVTQFIVSGLQREIAAARDGQVVDEPFPAYELVRA